MRWYARPENDAHRLRVAPRLASWNKSDDPDQVRLRAYLDDTAALLAESRVDGEWALRLDVGMSEGRDLLGTSDLDNFAYPLAYHLRDPGLVSVWCTKQHSDRSFVRIDAAREVSAPSAEVLVARTTVSASTAAYKEQIRVAVVGATELPSGPVRLELAFVVGPRRNWVNLWKQTIDALDPILGRTNADRDWHPRDGRIIELGMHVTVDPAAGNEIVVGIAASPASTPLAATAATGIAMPERKVVFRGHGMCLGKYELRDGTATAWDVSFPHWPTAMQMSTEQAKAMRDALVAVLGDEHAQ
ncbi:hypothetical protein [Mycolicibacterium vinylchloridicum]|uniref:hypothetical protein n=1 Tax=Mycolicibacterium vinylchloridicum TaxID=2736928 RepID=UPI0015CD2679|nr:hypothetical protein [Mycolicibacterium vinylchloridicum]